MPVRILISLCLMCLMSTGLKAAEDVAERRAKFNYQMFCQGCHAADGSGHKRVPQLKGFMHKFMASQQGREYLVRVPGSANSVLDDEQLSEVLNWMLVEFAGSQSGAEWQPYKAEEVAQYRKNPLFETIKYRQALLKSLNLESEL